MAGECGKRGPYRRLTGEERARFIEVLRATGNRRAAAAAIGADPRGMDQRREHDPELDAAWTAAVDAAHSTLSAAAGPFDFDPDAAAGTGDGGGLALGMVRRGKKGRLQLTACGESRWNAQVEQRFLAVLRETGNVRASAHAVGFSEGTIWDRRRRWPAFAEALEAMLEEAEMALEFRIASMRNNVTPGRGGGAEAAEGAFGAPTPGRSLPGRGDAEGAVRFDMEAAMRFLKWREEKRQGSKRRAPRAKPPEIEAVIEKVVRRAEAIRRHRLRRQAGESEAGD